MCVILEICIRNEERLRAPATTSIQNNCAITMDGVLRGVVCAIAPDHGNKFQKQRIWFCKKQDLCYITGKIYSRVT